LIIPAVVCRGPAGLANTLVEPTRRDQGVIDSGEFEREKAKILA
jgi:hypothetical protein